MDVSPLPSTSALPMAPEDISSDSHSQRYNYYLSLCIYIYWLLPIIINHSAYCIRHNSDTVTMDVSPTEAPPGGSKSKSASFTHPQRRYLITIIRCIFTLLVTNCDYNICRYGQRRRPRGCSASKDSVPTLSSTGKGISGHYILFIIIHGRLS